MKATMIIHLNRLRCELARYRSWAKFAEEMRLGNVAFEAGNQFVVRDEQAPWLEKAAS